LVILMWLLLPRPGDGITPENAARIRDGMTEAQVRAVVGCPPGIYGCRDYLVKRLWANLGGGRCVVPLGRADDCQNYWWVGDRGILRVGFVAGRACGQGRFWPADPPTLWDRLSRLLPW
jgi:hypothetical protein